MFEYRPRQLKPMPLTTFNQYRLKRYSLYFSDVDMPETSEQEWQALLTPGLPQVDDPSEHRLGFAIMHYAQDGNYLLVSRWYGGNMLKHEAFTLSETPGGQELTPLLESRIVACVWELEVIGFERDAWVRTVMAHGGSPESFELYLDMTFSGWV